MDGRSRDGREPGVKLRAAATAAAGLVVLAAGAAIAVPWLADTGLGVVSVVAAVVAVLGLVILVVGSVALVRSFRGWRKVPVALAVVVVAVIGLYVLAIPVVATNVPPDSDTAAPADPAAEEVRFESADGVDLAGSYLPPARGSAGGPDDGVPAGAAVVVVPGSGSTRAGAWDQAVALWQEGLGVLVVDPRGHGRSRGDAMDLGWYGDEDLRGAVDWLGSQDGVDAGRIGAVGLSMGGEQVLGAAASDDRIRAVVAEGATGRSADDHWWLPDEYGVAGRVQLLLDRAMYGVVDLLVDRGPPTPLREAVRDMAPRPALIVAAGEVEDEVAVADRLESASPGNVEVWVVDGSGHTGGYDRDPRAWTERVVGFLSEALR